jgi:hypothetical protein
VDGAGLLRDSVAWFALKPSVNGSGVPSASIVHQGYVVAPNGYSLLYPAFGLNKSGAGALGLSITNQSANVHGGFPSAGFIQFNGTGTTGKVLVSGQGIASDDGFTGCDMGPGGVGRWGDYGAAMPRPGSSTPPTRTSRARAAHSLTGELSSPSSTNEPARQDKMGLPGLDNLMSERRETSTLMSRAALS